MARWKKNATEFPVSVYKRSNRDGSPDRSCNLPRPVTDVLGDPDKIRFILDGGQVRIEADVE